MKFVLLLLALAIPASAQVESVKLHYGDDMRWADPSFDDSDWMSGNARIEPFEHLLDTWYWVRLKLRMPDASVHPVVGLMTPVVEVYANGRLIGHRGRFLPDFQDAVYRYQVWQIPPETARAGQLITMAVRVWKAPGIDLRRLDNRALSLSSQIYVHPAGETPVYETRLAANHLGQRWCEAIEFLLLLFLLGSGRARWTGREFKLLSAFVLMSMINHVCFTGSWIFPWGNRMFVATAIAQAISAALQLELIALIANVRPGMWLRTVQLFGLIIQFSVAAASAMLTPPWWLPALGRGYAGIAALNLTAALVVLALQKADGIGPRLLPIGLVAASAGNVATRFLPSLGVTGGMTVGDVFFSATVAGSLVFAVLLIVARMRQLRRDGEVAIRLQAQFAAARSVQEMLLASGVPHSPGYAIDAIYRPAEEVGGDFFRVLPAADDATLVIVGDVSGKGLRAAMLVSVTVGAFLNRRSNEPDELLAELNAALAGQMEGGFVTCCCARFEPSGKVLLANAGHPPPYLDGREIDCEAGLPLGIVRGGGYRASEIKLAAGSQFTLVSDGVVEAQNNERELFGFERARQISSKPARQIAEAARAWGQNDDITVVTVQRNS